MAIVWIRELMMVFEVHQSNPTALFVDNQGAVAWGKEGVRNAKQVSVKKNNVKELRNSGVIEVQ